MRLKILANNRAAIGASFSVEQLESFVGLVHWGKQAAVTAALGKSQSQVSRDLASLEQALGGVVLFDRAERKATARGEAVLAYAQEVLAGWERLHTLLAEEEGGEGEVVLATDPDVMPLLLPVLARLHARLPRLCVATKICSTQAARRALAAGDADVAIIQVEVAPAGLHCRLLLCAEFRAIVSERSPLARRKRISAEMMRHEVALLPPCDSGLRGVLERRGLVRGKFAEFGSGREQLGIAAAAGLGVALVPVFPFAGETLSQAVPVSAVMKPVGREFGRVEYWLAVRRGIGPGGPASALIRTLLREFRQEKGTSLGRSSQR